MRLERTPLPAFVALLHVPWSGLILDSSSPFLPLFTSADRTRDHRNLLRAQSPTSRIPLSKQRSPALPYTYRFESRVAALLPTPRSDSDLTCNGTCDSYSAAIACSGLPPTEGGDGPQGKAEDQLW
jgi:hypothetical protein